MAGTLHLVAPGIYRGIVPPWLPAHDVLIALSGVAELAGGAGLLVQRTRRAAGWGLILLLIAVFPANIQMLLNHRASGVAWWGELLLWLRLLLQGLLIWWVWRASQPRSRVSA